MVRCSFKNITIISVLLSLTLIYYYSQKTLFISSVLKKNDYEELTTTDTSIYYQVPPTNSVTYIRGAYRVYNTEIRISVIKLHKSRVNIYYKYGDEIGKVYFICELSTCLDYYSKPCNMIGYIGLIKSNKLGNDENIYFSTTNKPDSYNVEVKIKDVRIGLNHFYPVSSKKKKEFF
uniref:Uncharacterized protein n=1 Tax=Panagrolaimus sp. PS1159 TaxID=55785 RepID=A0AC35GJQ7_9BILA